MVAKKMPNIRVILCMHTKNIFDRRIERTKNLISKYGNCEWSVVTMYYVVFRDEMYTQDRSNKKVRQELQVLLTLPPQVLEEASLLPSSFFLFAFLLVVWALLCSKGSCPDSSFFVSSLYEVPQCFTERKEENRDLIVHIEKE